MPPLRRPRILPVLSLATLVTAPGADAAQRTFVASNGNDASACTIPAPCRSFGAALAHTSDGGEIIVLDSAGYGSVTIAQSVSIVSPPGVYAGVSVTSGTGITIAGSGIRVSLRGLTLTGIGGTNGIVFQQGGELHLERIEASGFASSGIKVTADGSKTTIDDAVLEHNSAGVTIGAPTTVARADMNRVRASNNSDGVMATDLSIINVRDCITTYNSQGIHANTQLSATGASAEINVDRSLISYNSNAGVRAITTSGTSSLVRVARSFITDNTNNAIASFAPGTIVSEGDNTVIGNTAGEIFDGTFSPK
jgi:hypothetical protein